MASKLRVDSILPVDGAPTSGGGGVIQVVSATKTDTQTFTSQGNHDITGLSVTITPKFATSKMLVMYTVNVGPTEGGYSAGCH